MSVSNLGDFDTTFDGFVSFMALRRKALKIKLFSTWTEYEVKENVRVDGLKTGCSMTMNVLSFRWVYL